MTKFYLIRHGQTDYNKAGKVQGRLDTPLNEQGISQAEQMSEELKDVNFDVIYYSPLTRAQQTAEIIRQHHPESEFIVAPEIIERDFGEYEGTQAASATPPYYGLWSYHTETAALKDAESIQTIKDRVYPFLDQLIGTDRTICLVCHGGVALVIREYFEGTPESQDLLDFTVMPHAAALVFEK